MTHKVIGFVIALFLGLHSNAQVREWGIIAGASNYLGDVSPYLAWNETHPAYGLYLKYNHNSSFSFRLQCSKASLSGHDKNFKWYNERNLGFKTNIIEAGLIMEYNFLPYARGILAEVWTPYAFTGIMGFHFNPMATYQGLDYELRLMGTEGQYTNNKSTYSQIQIAIPLGLGVKYNLKERFIIGAELGFRWTSTDYLDDVSGFYPDVERLLERQGVAAANFSDGSGNGTPGSYRSTPGQQRGDDTYRDWYVIANVSVGFRLIPVIRCFQWY